MLPCMPRTMQCRIGELLEVDLNQIFSLVNKDSEQNNMIMQFTNEPVQLIFRTISNSKL